MLRPAAMLAAVVLLCAAAVPSQAAQCLPAAPANPDGNYIVPGAKGGIVYRTAGSERLQLDAWAPPGATRRPVVVVVHGGGLVAGSRVSFVGQFLELLSDAGFAWVSVDYRLAGAGGGAAAAEDVAGAVRFVRCRASELRVDPGRIVLLGEDSGADLAAAVAVRGSPGVIGAVLVGGRYAGPAADVVAPATGGPAPGLWLAVHGGADTDVPAARADAFCAARRAAGARCELLVVDGGSHRAENWWPSQWGYKSRLVRFLCDAAPFTGCGLEAEPAATASPNRLAPLAPGLHSRVPFAPGLRMNAWLPAPGSGRAPAVILVHGGGWEAGDRVTYITPVFEPLARAGFAWFSIDYRLTPAVRHAAQLEDVRAAVRHVRGHARRYGIDPDALALLGESASGQMATLLAAESDLRLAGVVSFYGVYDFLPMVTDASPRSLLVRLFGPRPLDSDARALLTRHSPLHRAHAGLPPVLLIHGTRERLWEQGLAMAERLRTLGVPHELVRLEGAPHGMEAWEGRPEWQGYKTRLVTWLRATLSPASRP